jgi:hypothetical protein
LALAYPHGKTWRLVETKPRRHLCRSGEIHAYYSAFRIGFCSVLRDKMSVDL